MSLFHELRCRAAKVLFVCQREPDLPQIEESLARADASDVLQPSIAVATQLPNLNLASFDVIVNLSDRPIPNRSGVYLLNESLDCIEEIIPFLASHFRWAREWKFSEEAASQTTPMLTPAAGPQLVVARAASV